MVRELIPYGTFEGFSRKNKHTGKVEYPVPRGSLVVVRDNSYDHGPLALAGYAKVAFMMEDAKDAFRRRYHGPFRGRAGHFGRWLVQHGYVDPLPMDAHYETWG